MAGIYLHIPFCKKACHYCNFHFSTSLHRKPALVNALIKEINAYSFPTGITPERRIETVYFGGGTPSILSEPELTAIFRAIRQNFDMSPGAEITIEANPDDINVSNLLLWKRLGINRLSIGIQSFADADLQWMNRAHNASEAMECITLARAYGFENFSIDLIYGTPSLTDEQWEKNVVQAIALGINHLSCYALTVEDRTALMQMIKKGLIAPVQEEKQSHHFELLMQWMKVAGFEHYEISNFALPGHRSRHNSHYWAGHPYYGFGPSAHSYDGKQTRWWNVASNSLYIDRIEKGLEVFGYEILSTNQSINELIMTSLRTMEGLPVNAAHHLIGEYLLAEKDFEQFWKAVKKMESNKLLYLGETHIQLTEQGKLFADGIAADLFL